MSSQDNRNSTDSDGRLLAAHLAGDRTAFGELVKKHKPLLERVVRRYVRSQGDVDDVVQQSFIRAYEAASDLRDDAKFRSWLLRIGVNLAISHQRRKKGEPLSVIEDDRAFATSLGTSRLVAREVWAKLVVELEKLPPKQRVIVELRLFHDLSFEEIGAIVESSEDSAKVSYHHAVKKVRSILGSHR